MIRRGSFLSNAWLVTGTSVAAIAVLVFLLWSMGHHGKTLRLFCAAGMIKPVSETIEEYERTYGITVQADYKGTGDLMVSIAKVGVPGDLFLSADSTTMKDAVKEGLVAEVIPIAEIRPVIVVHGATQERLMAEGKPVKSLADLVKRDDLKVALAHEGAAIGRVGKTILQKAGLWTALEERRRRGAHVSNVGTVMEVAARVSEMKDYVGLVWDATALDYPGLAVVRDPALDKVVEHIEIGVLTRADNPTAALHFARFLTARDKGLKAFAKHKFNVVPDADYWEEP